MREVERADAAPLVLLDELIVQQRDVLQREEPSVALPPHELHDRKGAAAQRVLGEELVEPRIDAVPAAPIGAETFLPDTFKMALAWMAADFAAVLTRAVLLQQSIS